jgi:hypothetical protein
MTLVEVCVSSLFPSFGPSLRAALPASSRRVAIPAGALGATTASADFSLQPHQLSPFRRYARPPQVRVMLFSPSRRIYVAAFWSWELRGCRPARPRWPRLKSGFCTSGRRLAIASFSPGLTADHLASCLRSLRPASSEDFHLLNMPMLGTPTFALRADARGERGAIRERRLSPSTFSSGPVESRSPVQAALMSLPNGLSASTATLPPLNWARNT